MSDQFSGGSLKPKHGGMGRRSEKIFNALEVQLMFEYKLEFE